MDKDPFSQRILKQILLKKIKVLNNINTDKNCLINNDIKSSPEEINKRIPITG